MKRGASIAYLAVRDQIDALLACCWASLLDELDGGWDE
jgi:hypothetical protein